MEAALTPGDAFPTADLHIADGHVRIGVMVCFDREFPESARALMLGGAEVILTPNACLLGDDRVGQLRARAFENMVGVAMANYAAPEPADPGGCDGRSVAFSGICFAPDGRPWTTRWPRPAANRASTWPRSISTSCAPTASARSGATPTASRAPTRRSSPTRRRRSSPATTRGAHGPDPST
jgi:predicted amidohydrolase